MDTFKNSATPPENKIASVVGLITELLFWLIILGLAVALMGAAWVLKFMTQSLLGFVAIVTRPWTVSSKAKRTDGW